MQFQSNIHMNDCRCIIYIPPPPAPSLHPPPSLHLHPPPSLTPPHPPVCPLRDPRFASESFYRPLRMNTFRYPNYNAPLQTQLNVLYFFCYTKITNGNSTENVFTLCDSFEFVKKGAVPFEWKVAYIIHGIICKVLEKEEKEVREL